MRTLLSSVAVATLVLVAAAPAAAAGPSSSAKKSPPEADPPAAPSTPAYTLPSWSDGAWGSSESYETIQAADLNGDGSDELIGRSPAGMEAWDFDSSTGQWTPAVAACQTPGDTAAGSASCDVEWTDAAGWDRKEFFRTIGTGDIDGDGSDEVFGRAPAATGTGSAGIQVAKVDWSDVTWTPTVWELLTTAAYFDGEAWSDADQYETIQAADVNGDGRDEIVGRGTDGMQVIGFTEAGTWCTSTFPAFSDADGFTSESHYATIRAVDIDHDGHDEIIGRGKDGLEVWKLDNDVICATADESADWNQVLAAGVFPDPKNESDEGWDNPDHYLTIQYADLTGDGTPEVFGRGFDQLQVYQWQPPKSDGKAAMWAPITPTNPTAPPFTNANGWTAEDKYLTIQAADVDGDGRAEVLGRDADGMTVWGLKTSATSSQWVDEQTSAGTAFTDDLGWTKPRYYATIQTADVDAALNIGTSGAAKAGRAELLGRGPSGIQTYQFDSGGWVSPSAQFPAWSDPQDKNYLAAYQAISSILDPTTQDIRGQYLNATTDQLSGWYSQLTGSMLELVPQGIPAPVASAVRDELATEVSLAHEVADAWDGNAELTQALFANRSTDSTAEHILGAVSGKSGNPSNTFDADLIDFLGGLAVAAADVAAPEVQILVGVFDAAVSFSVSEGQGTSSSFSGDYDGLERNMNQVWLGSATHVATLQREAIMSDLGLLTAVGGLYLNDVWPKYAPNTPNAEAAEFAAARAYSIWVWQSLTPTLDEPCDKTLSKACGGWELADCTATEAWCLYSRYTGGENYDNYTLVDIDCTTSECHPSDGYRTTDSVAKKNTVPTDLLKQLTRPLSCANGVWDPATCDYGVSAEDVALGLGGWSYKCTIYVPRETDDSGHSSKPDSFCTDLSDLRDQYGRR